MAAGREDIPIATSEALLRACCVQDTVLGTKGEIKELGLGEDTAPTKELVDPGSKRCMSDTNNHIHFPQSPGLPSSPIFYLFIYFYYGKIYRT